MKQITAPIISSVEVVSDTSLLWLEAPEITAAARPGQFVMVRCGEDTTLRRPLSVHRTEGGRLALLVNIAGKGTRWLSKQKPGESLDVFGPLGNGFSLKPGVKNILLVAGGIGIAPLRFLADVAAGQGKKVTILTGARTGDCLLPVTPSTELLREGMMSSNIFVVCATDDGSEGYKGTVTGLVPAYLDSADQIFACGPLPMYRTMAQMPELKDRDVQVSLEIAMACGIGICYSCTIRTKSGLKQVCKHGPVFDMGEIEWGEVIL